MKRSWPIAVIGALLMAAALACGDMESASLPAETARPAASTAPRATAPAPSVTPAAGETPQVTSSPAATGATTVASTSTAQHSPTAGQPSPAPSPTQPAGVSLGPGLTDFTLPDAINGGEVTLSEAALDGPIVLVLYRAFW